MATKQICFLSIFFLCLPLLICGQSCPPASFKKIFYQNDSTLYPDNIIDAINVTGDSGYFIGGTQVAKINLNGNNVWNGSQNNNYFGADPLPYYTPDGNYFLVLGNYHFLHIDANETILWQNFLLNTNCYCNPVVKHITQTSDGGFIITGSKTILDTTFYRNRIFIIKTNSTGDTLWTKTIGKSPSDNEGYYSQETSDGGFLVLANIKSNDTIPDFKVGVLKLNSNGQEQWFKTETRSIFYGATIKGLKTIENDCAIVASIDSNLVATYFVKINENGDVLLDTVFQGKKFNGGFTQLENGDYLIGMQDSLTKIDGNTTAILGNTAYLGSSGENIPINSVKTTCDNGLIMGGTSAIYNSTYICHGSVSVYNDYYSYFIKTDSTYLDVAITGISEKEGNVNTIRISPNPFSTQATLTVSNNLNKATLKIMDLLGKEVKSLLFSGKQFILENTGLNAGIYFVQVMDEKGNKMTQKIVIQ